MADNNLLGTLFLKATARNKTKTAIRLRDKNISYANLHRRVITFTLHLQNHSITPQSRVALAINGNPLQATIAILAITLLGGCWLTYSQSLTRQRSLGVTHLLHNDPARPVIPGSICVSSEWYQAPESYRPGDHISLPGYSSADDIWFIAQSSGSTGIAKFIPISGRMFHHRIMALCELPEGDAPLVVTDIFRRATNLACLHFLHTLHMGGTYVFHDDYENFCSANVSRVVASPSHVSRLLADLPIPDSPGIHEVRVVGGAIQPKLLTRFLKYFRVVTTTYGSTEAGPTTYRRFTEYDSDTSVGPFYSGVALEIVDDDHRPVKPCSEGQIRIRTGGQIHEYMDNIEASKQAFREGWFYPGDKGYYSEDGKLYVIGRIQDEFNAGGLKVNAAMIDRAIQDTDDVVDGMCFLETDEQGNETLATIVSLEPNSIIANVVEAAGKAILERDPDQYCLPRTYYQIGEIPRNPNGKIMRHLAAGLIEGLRPIARRDIDDVAYTVL